jgi:hypothetical protein
MLEISLIFLNQVVSLVRSVSDVMFDVVKEVVSELVGGLLTSTLGIGTAR